MHARHLSIAAAFAVAASCTREALAGMPSPVLSDWAEVRFETISFVLVALLICTAVIRWLWNSLARDFSAMPRLSYGKTLAMVMLLGLFLMVVLTMIAGARELLTPGAWQKQGQLYKMAAPSAPSKPTEPKRLAERKEHLLKLQAALWQYAAGHDGRFPAADKAAKIEPALWDLPGVAGMQYVYVPGLRLKAAGPPRPLVYEPDVYDGQRLVLRTDGEIVVLPTAELRQLLPEKPR